MAQDWSRYGRAPGGHRRGHGREPLPPRGPVLDGGKRAGEPAFCAGKAPGHDRTGRIAGRKHPFGTVLWGNGYSAEWSWDTIARCLNEGKPLQA